jgi:16S rRNA (cytosine1402-N4)-methyltransferase
MYHVPVLLQESIDALAIRADGVYVDGTMGGGGHLQAIVERLGRDGTAVGIDRDPQAVAWCREHLRAGSCRLVTVVERFGSLGRVLADNGIRRVDGLLLDLGVSSHQLDEAQRGFSYQLEGPLDMRMGPDTAVGAAQFLRESDMETIAAILREYGEIRNAPRMARLMDALARQGRLLTTTDLREGLSREYGELPPKVLSKVFQALRIAVNGELGELRQFLAQAAAALAAGGRLAVIAYHSLEDRIVKNFLRDAERGCVCPPRAPVCTCGKSPEFKRVNRSVIVPSEQEVARNRRARSARLRAAERCA